MLTALVAVPPRASTGLYTHQHQLLESLQEFVRPATAAEQTVDLELWLGNRLGKHPDPRTSGPRVLWPLNVAPMLAHRFNVKGAFGLADRGRNLGRLALLAESARRADGLVFSSHFARDCFFNALPLRRPSFVLPPSLPILGGISECRGSQSQRMALCASHRYRYKRVSAAVATFAATSEMAHWRLELAGSGVVPSEEGRIAASSESLCDRFTDHGAVNHDTVQALLERSSVFILPTILENAAAFPIQEAAAAAVPVAVSGTKVNVEFLGEHHPYVDFGIGLDGIHLGMFADSSFRLETSLAQSSRIEELRLRQKSIRRDFVDWVKALRG